MEKLLPGTVFPVGDISGENLTPDIILYGIVTVKWPYSSQQKISRLQICDQQNENRIKQGEVRITLVGDGASAVDQIPSGDLFALRGEPEYLPKPADAPSWVKVFLKYSKGCEIFVSETTIVFI
jgi:hypothetical protein